MGERVGKMMGGAMNFSELLTKKNSLNSEVVSYLLMQIDDLKAYRQWGSRTPGHPENFETDGVEVTTGLPLNI